MKIIRRLKSLYTPSNDNTARKKLADPDLANEADSAYKTSYREKTKHLLETKSVKTAMSIAIGGEYDAIGKLECALLKSLGLGDGSFLIDVGCGSGRLAVQIKDVDCQYTGIDVVEDLLNYARSTCKRPDWKFAEVVGFSIPEGDAVADFVCFFSVITHLTHADSFRYLQDAARVLRPGGKIVISFLEFKIPAHWDVFKEMIGKGADHNVLNQFISRDALYAWGHHLNLQVDSIHDGDTPHIPISEVITLENGTVMKDLGFLGQSVCVLSKPSKNPINRFEASITDAARRKVQIHISVRDRMRGRQANVYVAAKEPTKETLYNATPKGFDAAVGLSSLSALQTVVLGDHVIPLMVNVPDLQPGCALELYVGYGSSPDDMIQNGDYAHIHTFAESGQ